MKSNLQNNLIVSGKSQKKKRSTIFPTRCCVPIWRGLPVSENLGKIRIGNAALSAPPVNSLESRSRMIARGFAKRRFFICLRIGHALIDALENLFFREPGIFQTADFRAAHGTLAP